MKAVDDLQTGLENGRHQLFKRKKKKKKVIFQKKRSQSRLIVESTN